MPAEVLASSPRHLQSPHPRNASVEAPVSALPPLQSPQSLNAPVQTSVSASQPLQPSQPNSTLVQASFEKAARKNPFQGERQLREDALASISSDKREFVKKHVDLNSDLDIDAAKVQALRGISSQIMNFASVFDVATNAQAEVLSLPWAGIRSVLMVAQMAHGQDESILEGIETVLDTNTLLSAYFSTYSQVGGTPTIKDNSIFELCNGLYHSIVKLYGRILEFVAQSQDICYGMPVKQAVQSLTHGVIKVFKSDHDGMLRTVEYHARAVDREVSEEQRALVKQKLNSLEKAQQEIYQRVQGVQQALDLSALQAAAGAAYDSMDNRNADENGELQLCLKDTREQIIKDILDWATTDDD
ncbi:hypothetical protein K470DRAFT_272809 [Piedraia hortae CBS 480.64]|uniref:NWD NACHT-NTPase N-terminal domain-containing protein n=1 Tax=Piedraia hortae CBS 480.64 TaxID=1314780 RepID=A0A6A7BS16_9PEZI|nr:hypothetical protein K470DRAFT_272809 [Piedraia hortae CBS 480.64]